MVLVKVQSFGTGTRYELLHQCGKSVKTKSQKFLGLIPTFVEVKGEKLVGGLFASPILNRVKYGIYFPNDREIGSCRIF